jgi:hypothetical protein
MSTPLVNTITGVVVGEYGSPLIEQLVDADGVLTDISSYNGTKTLYFRSPDSLKTVTATATFLSDGTDGKVTWSFANGDIDRPGKWTGQIVLNKTGVVAKSFPITMDVKEAVG